MSKVYFKAWKDGESASAAGRLLLETLVEREHAELDGFVPLKVHFGEKGNRTYLKPETYDGIIDYLEERHIRSEFMETCVLYGGERFTREKHTGLALAHGFTRLPVVIADGERGEEAVNVPIHQKHCENAGIAKALAEAGQVIVLSHFKGHGLAGFGGAIKQLSMGFAAKGGKMAMHLGVKPRIWNFLCRHCGLCVARCQPGAIHVTPKKSWIDHDLCIGCGACFSICPRHAVSILSLAGLRNALLRGRDFREKLVEYAYASHHGKRHLYITFALGITRGCDCEPRPMRPCVHDIGVYASLDPVAIDAACWDAAAALGKKFKGREQLNYGEKIGLGSTKYDLISLE